ncbi:MAG: pyridoxamine 5'-phosphate oxidase family protein [Deferrisomatales bacterium]|nr:pyridoxamine 5'-phosphate oxidase family protein [Deferrisomatales bacterium]
MTAGWADREAIRALLRTQRLGALSTQGAGQPYASLVAFAATGDFRHVLFATSRSTRKYGNLAADPRAALLLDDRSEGRGALGAGTAATATGRAEEVPPGDREACRGTYLARHPHLADFVADPGCALLRMRVEEWVLVRRFQEVVRVPGDLPEE